MNGISKLFIEINNSKDWNQFINLINESEQNHPIENVNKIIAESFYLVSSRVFGRKIEKFDNILQEIKDKENADNDAEGKQGRNVFKIADKYLKDFKLRGKRIKAYRSKKSCNER